MKYETTPEDRQRRKFLTKRDLGQAFDDNFVSRRIMRLLDNALRSGREVFKLGIRKMKDNRTMLGVFVFLVSIWLSGWFASSGMAFESLLSVVLGVVVPGLIMKGDSDGRS